jgi:hypothetical protein
LPPRTAIALVGFSGLAVERMMQEHVRLYVYCPSLLEMT